MTMRPREGTGIYTVSAMVVPLSVGMTIYRSAWPAHITVAPNFATTSSEERLLDAVRRVTDPVTSVEVALGAEARFGARSEIPVLLVESAWVVDLHERLLGELQLLEGFQAEAPDHWRGGFIPHLTLGSRVTACSGQSVRIASIAVSRLDGGEAAVIAVTSSSDAQTSNR